MKSCCALQPRNEREGSEGPRDHRTAQVIFETARSAPEPSLPDLYLPPLLIRLSQWQLFSLVQLMGLSLFKGRKFRPASNADTLPDLQILFRRVFFFFFRGMWVLNSPRILICPEVAYPDITYPKRGAFDSAKNHKRQRCKRQSVTPKREQSLTPKFV